MTSSLDYIAPFDIDMYYSRHGTNLPEKRVKLEYTVKHQLLSISVASNVPGYEEPQGFVVKDEGKEQTTRLCGPSRKNRRESQRVRTATLYSTPNLHRRNLGALV